MKKIKTIVILTIACLVLPAGVCYCDTFTNHQTKEVLQGYPIGQQTGGLTKVYTKEKGILSINPAEWQITRDNLGRNSKVLVVPIDSAIMFEIETAAFEQALAAEANEGTALILIEIDTPGGRIDLVKQMCSAIANTTNCDVIAFIRGGEYGGAISGGAAVALACGKVYMANNTVIGAASIVTGRTEDKNKSYKEVIDEKHSSAWRAYLASLAQHKDRPGLLARAMVDSAIDVIEVNEQGKRAFIEPMNKKADQEVVKTWNKAGSLVTLTAEEAVGCTIADGLVNSRQDLLQKLQLADANVIIDKKIASARKDLQIAQRKKDETLKAFDLKVKQSQYPQPMPKYLAILNGARDDFKTLKILAQKYPDLNLNIDKIELLLNSLNAAYENALRESKTKNRK